MHKLATPLGDMVAVANDRGICLLEFADCARLDVACRGLEQHFGASIASGENACIRQVQRELAEYFNGQRTVFEVPIDTPGTDFQHRVWALLRTIPYGTTTSYQAQAAALQHPKAIRAMAAANGQNRVAIIVPCHRVIGKGGQLTGYAGGLARKRWLLDLEASVQPSSQLVLF